MYRRRGARPGPVRALSAQFEPTLHDRNNNNATQLSNAQARST